MKITEDLAPGIKMIFNEVSRNRRWLNVDSVWTIDGKIKYRFTNNPRTFEIRSYSDYRSLFNARQYGSSRDGQSKTSPLANNNPSCVNPTYNQFSLKLSLGILTVLEVQKLSLSKKQAVHFSTQY